MKVLFLSRALGPGGAERQLALMAAGLQKRGHDIIVATFYPGGNFLPDLIKSGVRHICLDKRGRWDIVGFAQRFRHLVGAERPDVLYSLLPPANIIASCVAPNVAGMRRVWGVRVSDMQLSHYGWLERASYTLERHFSKMADLVVFNSRSGRRHAEQKGMEPRASDVIPNGIDTTVFAPDGEAHQSIRDTWGVAEDEYVIGVVGRFDPMKDHQTFVSAAGKLIASHPNLRFILAGTGVESRNSRLVEMLRAVGISERTLLLGERSDMPRIMTGFDIFCLSSAFGEGFPNVLGEAMAAGTPCVSTDVGDARQILGGVGEVVSPGDPAALAGAIERLLGRLGQSPETLRKAARARIVENFSVELLIDRTESRLKRLAASCTSAVPVISPPQSHNC
jgi:glycosyltransferase involved in cell wall biosynthesis